MLPFPPLRRGLVAVVAAAALTLAAACSDGDDTADLAEVTYVTGFGASAHDAFIFVADEQGFFADQDIEVTIELGTGATNYPSLLAGESQFTYTDLTGLLRSIGVGELEETDFVALAAVHHTTLAAILVPEDVDVATPADLEGRTIGAFASSPTDFLLPAYAALSGWEYDDELLTRAGGQELFGMFAAGNFEVMSTFIIQQGVIENIIEKETTAFPMDEFLGDLLGTGLITSKAFADENPEVATRFREAAIEGLKYTLANPEEAIEILQSRNPEAVDPNAVPGFVAQIGIMDRFITGQGEDRIGVIDPARAAGTADLLVSYGIISTEVDSGTLLHEVTLTAVS